MLELNYCLQVIANLYLAVNVIGFLVMVLAGVYIFFTKR